jgi:RNB domain
MCFLLFSLASILPLSLPLSISPSPILPPPFSPSLQAERRMVSVYMPDERISMFPYTLSTELLSLGAGVDSYALSCGVTLDEQGTLWRCCFSVEVVVGCFAYAFVACHLFLFFHSLFLSNRLPSLSVLYHSLLFLSLITSPLTSTSVLQGKYHHSKYVRLESVSPAGSLTQSWTRC